MIELIQNALHKSGINLWRITETVSKTAELYYIKKELDIPRYKDMKEYRVEVFRDFSEGDNRFLGSTAAYIAPDMDDSEVERSLKDAFRAAAYVKNPYYELPEGIQKPHVPSGSDLRDYEIQKAAKKMGKALFAADTADDAFINSAELFVSRTRYHILASNGLDVSYDRDLVSGELVTQCVTPQDVEQYRGFRYDRLDQKGLQDKVTAALEDVRKRARANSAPKAGTYDILLTGEQVREVLGYYLARSSASMIYPGYSSWKLGNAVQGESIDGEALNLTLVSTRPFSDEGIPMPDRPLLEKGRLATIHGDSRFCRYLGVEPTGSYGKIRCDNGTRSIQKMRTPGVLEAVSFSDFQMDAFSGHFGGEFRLAQFYGEDGVSCLTGGSLNGSLNEVQGKLVFSKERYSDGSYEGPLAVLIPGIPVAGI